MSLGAIVSPHAATSKQGAAAPNKYLQVFFKVQIYFLTALGDKALHLGLKDSKFAFNKWSKPKQSQEGESKAWRIIGDEFPKGGVLDA